MNVSDAALIEKWKILHDPEAFTELVARHSAMVYRVACRILRDPGHAEEVAQECFLLLAEKPAVVRRSPAGWLHALAASRALDRLRTEQSRLARESRYAEQTSTVCRPQWNDIQGYVDEAVADLPETLREAVVYRYLEGHSLAETAQCLAISRSTVQARLEKAVGEIRQSLKGRGVVVPVGMLISALGVGSAEAAPVTLTLALGKLALAGTSGVPASSVVSSVAVTGGLLAMKKIIVGAVVVLGILAGLYWTMQAHQTPTDHPSQKIVSTVQAPEKTTSEQPDSSSTTSIAVSQPAATEKTVETPVTTTLEPGEIADPTKYATLSGRTLTELGEPVAGAEVKLACYGIPRSELLYEDIDQLKRAMKRNHLFQAVSDTEGRFFIKNIRFSGHALVMAQARGTLLGSASAELQDSSHQENMDIVLKEGAHIVRGRLLTSAGVPVDDATVTPVEYPKTLCHTDARGNFEIVCLVRSTLNVYSPQYGLATFNEFWDVEDQFHELRMPGMASLSGRVTQSDGSPAAGVKIKLAGSAPLGESSVLDQTFTAVTDLNGQYKIREINASQKMVATIKDTAGQCRVRKSFGYLPPNQMTTWDAQFSKPIVVRGTVRGMQNHQPLALPGLFEITVVKDGQALATEGGAPNAFPKGIYEITVPAGSGRYLIVPTYTPFYYSGFESYGREVNLVEGTEPIVDLELPEPITVMVRIVDENGNPLKGATVKRTDFGSDLGTTDEGGRLKFSCFAPNTMGNIAGGSIEIACQGYFTEQRYAFSGSPGQILPEETIVLHPAGEVTGRPILIDGEPMPNGKLWVRFTYGNGMQQSLAISTDSKGQFRLAIPATSLDLVGSLVPPNPLHSFSRTGLQCLVGQTLNLGDIQLENIDRSPKNE